MACFAGWITTDARIFAWAPPNDPLRQEMERVDRVFGGTNIVIVALHAPEGDIFTLPRLAAITRLHRRLERLAGVRRVMGLAAVTEMSSAGEMGFGVEARALLGEIPSDAAGLRALRGRVLSDPLLAGELVSKGGESTLLICELDRKTPGNRVVEGIHAAVEGEKGDFEPFLIGEPVATAFVARHLAGALWRIAPAMLLPLGILAFGYRPRMGAFLFALLSIAGGIVWGYGTVGISSRFSSPVASNLVQLLPLLLLLLGSAVVSLVPPREGGEGWPYLLPVAAGGITLLGWGILVWGRLPSVGFVLVGCGAGMVTVGILARWGSGVRISSLPTPSWRGAIALLVMAVGLCIFAPPPLTPTLDPVKIFGEDSEVGRGFRHLDQYYGGSRYLTVRITGDLRHPGLLRRIEAFSLRLSRRPGVRRVTSIVEPLRQVGMAMTGEKHLPGSRERIASLWVFLAGQPVGNLVDPDRTETVIQIRLDPTLTDSAPLARSISEDLAQHFGRPLFAYRNLPDAAGAGAIRRQILEDLARDLHEIFPDTPSDLGRTLSAAEGAPLGAKERAFVEEWIVAFLTGEETLIPLAEDEARGVARRIVAQPLTADRIAAGVHAALAPVEEGAEIAPILLEGLRGVVAALETTALRRRLASAPPLQRIASENAEEIERLLHRRHDLEVLFDRPTVGEVAGIPFPVTATLSGFPLFLDRIEGKLAAFARSARLIFPLVALLCTLPLAHGFSRGRALLLACLSFGLLFLFAPLLDLVLLPWGRLDPGAFVVKSVIACLVVIDFVVLFHWRQGGLAGGIALQALTGIFLGIATMLGGFSPFFRMGGVMIEGILLAFLWVALVCHPLLDRWGRSEAGSRHRT